MAPLLLTFSQANIRTPSIAKTVATSHGYLSLFGALAYHSIAYVKEFFLLTRGIVLLLLYFRQHPIYATVSHNSLSQKSWTALTDL